MTTMPRGRDNCPLLRGLLPGVLALLYTALLSVASAAAMPAARVTAGSGFYWQVRDYTLHILPSGDVSVREHWQVQFTGGPFHTAHLMLYLAHTSGIVFGTVTGAVPGTQRVTDIADKDGNAEREILWEFPSTQDAERTFDIPYTLHGTLGVSAEKAWLDWHFLDGGSQETAVAEECTITVVLPAGTGANRRFLITTAVDADATPAVIHDGNTAVRFVAHHLTVSHPFEAEVVFPRGLLSADVQRPTWQVGDTPPQIPTPLASAPAVTESPGLDAAIITAILIFIVLFVAPFVIILSLPAHRRPKLLPLAKRVRFSPVYPWFHRPAPHGEVGGKFWVGRRGGGGGGGGGGAGGAGGGGGGGGGAGFG